ncbi:hypothetical protein HQ563_02945 [bacterium]|nr:hypothetical protein [bacterium]
MKVKLNVIRDVEEQRKRCWPQLEYDKAGKLLGLQKAPDVEVKIVPGMVAKKLRDLAEEIDGLLFLLFTCESDTVETKVVALRQTQERFRQELRVLVAEVLTILTGSQDMADSWTEGEDPLEEAWSMRMGSL